MVDNSNPFLNVILSAVALLVFIGLPFFVAASPGLVALTHGRRILAAVVVVGAACVIGIPLYEDHLETERLTAQGMVADSLAFLFLPWMYGIPYALASGVVVVAWFALAEPHSKHD
jgi:hypothetical protein